MATKEGEALRAAAFQAYRAGGGRCPDEAREVCQQGAIAECYTPEPVRGLTVRQQEQDDTVAGQQADRPQLLGRGVRQQEVGPFRATSTPADARTAVSPLQASRVSHASPRSP